MTNRAMNRGITNSERSCPSLLTYGVGLSCALFLCFVTVFISRSVYKLERLVSDVTRMRNGQNLIQAGSNITWNSGSAREKTCAFPFVYNKPHKTGSTKIRDDIVAWAQKERRRVFRCSGYISRATFQMRECIRSDQSGCAVIATHVVMSPVMREILEDKIGKYKLVTSTRDPKKRILSSFLQLQGTKARHVKNSTDLDRYLQSYNPWKLYNYHTGEARVGRCPMKEGEKALLRDMVNRADVVIDVDLFDVSQAILKHEGLFPLTDSSTNVRHASELVLEAETEELLRNAACVEEQMHKMYRIRMASAYQRATGKPCLSNSREVRDCFDEMYQESVK